MKKPKYTKGKMPYTNETMTTLDSFQILDNSDDSPDIVVEVDDDEGNIDRVVMTPVVACAYYLHRIAKHLEGGE